MRKWAQEAKWIYWLTAFFLLTSLWNFSGDHIITAFSTWFSLLQYSFFLVQSYICTHKHAYIHTPYTHTPYIHTPYTHRAWKEYARKEQHLDKTAKQFILLKMKNKTAIAFEWLVYWSFQRKKILDAWKVKGVVMRRKILNRIKNGPFQIWKAYTYYRNKVRKFCYIWWHWNTLKFST